MFTDTHCHLYEEYYDSIDDIIKKIKENGIHRVINNGCDSSSNKEVLDLIGKYPDFMYGALGIHPEEVDNYTEEDIDFIKKHVNNKNIIAIGEIGLDYHYTKDNKDKQKELFEKQLMMAQNLNIPVIIHSRDATLDTIECLKKYKVRGVIHSFSGSLETAKTYIKMGFLLGINGVVTFKNCNLKDVIDQLELKNLLLETDSPYLTPEPYRGHKNDSSHIVEIAQFIAEIKGVSIKEVSKLTEENVKSCFDI